MYDYINSSSWILIDLLSHVKPPLSNEAGSNLIQELTGAIIQYFWLFRYLTSSCQKSLIAYDDGEKPSFIKSCMHVWLNKMADESCWTLVESAHLCMCHRLLRQRSRSHPHTLRHCTLSHMVNINLQLALVHGYHWAMNGLGENRAWSFIYVGARLIESGCLR